MNQYRAELQAIGLILGIALIAAFGAVMTSASTGPLLSQPPTAIPTPRAVRPTPVPSVVPGPLNGLPTARRIATRRPLAVVIDNFYPDARPQSGLSKASLVFDALTEGGITRLMAVFLEHDASRVGPIRSARPYFVSWAAGFGAVFVHAGGSPSALQLERRSPSLENVDALQPGATFTRESARSSPHNLYGSTVEARATAQRSGGATLASLSGFLFGRAAPRHARGHAASWQIRFSTPEISSLPAYSVTYRYVPARNVYLRSQAGVPFVDAATGRQLAPTNVIVLFAQAAPIPNDPVGRVALGAVGGGHATLLQNGHTLQGRWSKASTSSPLSFTLTGGRAMRLVPGQTWIEVTPPGGLSQSSTP